VIVDEYQYVVPMGRSAKENMIATLFQSHELFAGGVIAAANHVAGFCDEVEVLTVLGDDHAEVVHDSLHSNVKLTALPQDDRPTTRKCRFVDGSYMRKLFEVYHMDDTPLSGATEDRLIAQLAEKAREADVVIVTDFGHGLITPRAVDVLSKSARFLAVNAQTNSANIGFNLITKYPRADYICIDEPEARLAVASKHAEVGEIASSLLPQAIDCDRFIITHGRNGCFTVSRGQTAVHIPAFTRTVVDTVGAGDAFLAITAPVAALGAPMELVGFIGNIAGALKVGIVGHRRAVEKGALLKYLETLLK
jgi:bifunctional ADP-heptose synthase (sugar kinase/adenylyltransferase)